MRQCAIVGTLAFFFSFPVFILYDIVVIPLPTKYGQGLNGTTCYFKEALHTYNFVLDVVYLILFFLCLFILVILYFRISKVLYIHRRNLRKSETTQHSDNRSNRIDRMTAKITIGMIVITTVFFLSFIPRLSLLAWTYIKGERASEFLSGTELLWFQIGKRSYMLNSSLNPWIYGIFNSRFRQFYYRKLCTVCRRSRDTTATTVSRETTESTWA